MTGQGIAASSAAQGENRWPGERLGLPRTGPRSIARLGRRIAAIALDWGLSVLVSVAFFSYDPWATLTIYAVTQVAFVSTAGGSVGHLVFGMRVVPLSRGWIGVLRPIIRTVLICLVFPAVIWDRDQRGVHDRVAATVLVRR